jgi:hypothetical protein
MLTMGDHLKAALYFEEYAEQELRPTERARLIQAARQFRWLALAEARRSAEGQAAGLCWREHGAERSVGPSPAG